MTLNPLEAAALAWIGAQHRTRMDIAEHPEALAVTAYARDTARPRTLQPVRYVVSSTGSVWRSQTGRDRRELVYSHVAREESA